MHRNPGPVENRELSRKSLEALREVFSDRPHGGIKFVQEHMGVGRTFYGECRRVRDIKLSDFLATLWYLGEHPAHFFGALFEESCWPQWPADEELPIVQKFLRKDPNDP